MQVLSPPEQINFAHNKALLNRYRFIEYETLRILAAWMPAAANMDWKLAMGRLLWEDAQHVQYLYQRLREIQTPAFRPPGDDALEHLMAEAIHAPTEADLLAGLFRVNQTGPRRHLSLALRADLRQSRRPDPVRVQTHSDR